MATTKSHQNAKGHSMRSSPQVDSPKGTQYDLVEHVAEYVRHNPGYTALCCVGVGFVLGWKLKPW